MKCIVIVSLMLVLLLTCPLIPQNNIATYAITNVTIVSDGSVTSNSNVVWRGNQIVAAGRDVPVPSGAAVTDGTDQTLLPGLFDVHTHLASSAGPGLKGDWQKNLDAYLYYGITTVADFSAQPEGYQDTRRCISEGKALAPRILLAARFTTPLGHGAEGGRDNTAFEVLTPRDAHALMEQVAPYHPDVLKIFTDGWRYGSAPDMTSMDQATVNMLVDQAHQRNIRVLTHTVTVEKAKVAARAGVDCIAHAPCNAPVDEELIRLLKENNTGYALTSAVYEPRRPPIDSPELLNVMEPALLAAVREQLSARDTGDAAAREDPRNPRGPTRSERFHILKNNTLALYRAGVPIVLGTDAGVTGTFHGWASIHELELLTAAGLPALETLMAGTTNAAKVLHIEDRGSIKAGKLADMVLVEGSPHQKIADIWKIRKVFLNGKELDRNALRADIQKADGHFPESFQAPAELDDFEAASGRSKTGSLWFAAYESGHDHSRVAYTRVLRGDSDHALSVQVAYSQRPQPFAAVVLPLSQGMMRRADVSGFAGVEFEARGEGDYQLAIIRASIRNDDYPQATFASEAGWKKVRIPFGQFKQSSGALPSVPWAGNDVMALDFQMPGAPGLRRWLELDNIRFYRDGQPAGQ